MNKVYLVALVTGMVVTGAYAADASNNSRSDVKADATLANKSGEIARGESNLMAAAQAKLSPEEMTALRAKVKAEAREANQKGGIAHGEGSGMAEAAQAKLTKEELAAVRASVKAETKLALKKGEIEAGEK